MDITTYQFSSEEVNKLQKYRDQQKDSRLKIRFMALLMIAERVSPSIVVSIVGKSRRTLENWFQQYITKGIDSLNSFQYKPKEPYLTKEQVKEVVKWVKASNPSDIKEVRDFVEDHFEVTYSLDAVRKLIKRHGLKYRRAKVISGDPPSEETQLEFIKEYQEIRSFSASGVVVLFCDAMHLIHQLLASFCWGDPKDPPVYKTNSGRKRLNILGGYDPDSLNFVHYTNETNCDANHVLLFFEKILETYPDAHSIVLILDNASYFHAKVVDEWLEKHPQFICKFLPAYAPNLNLIERFWRFSKKHLVRNTYYAHYRTFRAKVFQFLNDVTDFNEELKSLMTEKFEIISNNYA